MIDELKDRRARPPKRHFLKFHFGNKAASFLLLRNVLRDPATYSKHPHPEVAAAIMVVDKFQPQIQAFLCNFANAARDLDIDFALKDEFHDCGCKNALLNATASDFNSDGHVLTIDTRRLKWPYLKSLVVKGKKFRLEADRDTVLHDLKTSLSEYVAWGARREPTEAYKLQSWADSVYEKCLENWRRAFNDGVLRSEYLPDGFPGLRAAIKEAQQNLVFLHDDRAPHGLLFACKRWYQREMARYLVDSVVFEDCPQLSGPAVVEKAVQFNLTFGFPTGSGVVYNYGIWKPKKQKFRFIAGTRSPASSVETLNKVALSGPPRQPLYEAHKALVRILQFVEKVLKEKDMERQQKEGIRAYWGIDSVLAFTLLVRSNSDLVL